MQIVFVGPAGLVLVCVCVFFFGGGGDEIGVGFPWIHLWKYGYNHIFLGSNVKNNNGIDVFSA